MKQAITPTIIFTPDVAGSGIITFNDIDNFNFLKLYSIVNARTGQLVYQINDDEYGAVSVNGSSITLQVDTSSMLAEDGFQVHYDLDRTTVCGSDNSWRYGFGGTSIDATQMEVLQVGAGQTLRLGTTCSDGTWTRSTSTATITKVAHGLISNSLISVLESNDYTAVVKGSVVVTVLTADTFTIGCNNAGITTGGTLTYTEDISTLQILSGTTAGAETILKSKQSFSGMMDFNFSMHMNQVIANQEARVGLYECSNLIEATWSRVGTLLSINLPSHGLIAGQEFCVQQSSDETAVPNCSYALSKTPLTDTIYATCLNAGATSGTLFLFSYDSVADFKFFGTSATSAQMRTFRNIWDSPIAATVTSRQSGISIYTIRMSKSRIKFGDNTKNNTAAPSIRAERDSEIPSLSGNYFIMIRWKNNLTPPASRTILSFGFVEVIETKSLTVDLANERMPSGQSAIPVNITASTSLTIASISQSSAGGQGTSNKSMAVAQSSAISLAAYPAQAWAAASGNGAVLTNEYGSTSSYDINVTAWTVGTSTGLVVVLQWSPDNGTTWLDQWMTEPITAVGHVFIPALQVQGRVRMRWFHVSGSATTATVTVTGMSTSIGNVPVMFQYFDRTAGVGSGNAVLNNNSAAYIISGARNFTVVMDAGTATAVGSFKAQMSMDGSKWYDVSSAVPIAATTANLTIIPITSGLIGRFIRVVCTAAGTTQVINSIHISAVN